MKLIHDDYINLNKLLSGFYLCVAKNNYGEVMAEAMLTVLKDYEAVYEAPKNMSVMVGGTATFHCRTPLKIRPFIHWVRINEANMSLEVRYLDRDRDKSKIENGNGNVLYFVDATPNSKVGDVDLVSI